MKLHSYSERLADSPVDALGHVKVIPAGSSDILERTPVHCHKTEVSPSEQAFILGRDCRSTQASSHDAALILRA